ncbi:wd40 repeat proteinprl1/prl2-related [Anaeramoeba flamelloides]|uniref:Wd40 repeat proteinprl1/prl2-related n=2 Tax=Anaeramoeba flamelloides TaxID=1746091 RepID=A0AAV7YDD3_9EUKA|nr:wd40 repeat proteinprl1/prl2-related [Anaeramoeba flamelloides]
MNKNSFSNLEKSIETGFIRTKEFFESDFGELPSELPLSNPFLSSMIKYYSLYSNSSPVEIETKKRKKRNLEQVTSEKEKQEQEQKKEKEKGKGNEKDKQKGKVEEMEWEEENKDKNEEEEETKKKIEEKQKKVMSLIEVKETSKKRRTNQNQPNSNKYQIVPVTESLHLSNTTLTQNQRKDLMVLNTKKRKEEFLARLPKPKFHPQWKELFVIASHVGWVNCVDVEPDNEWFATGSDDRTIKLFDLASGKLKLTLTGHVASVQDIAISKNYPYLFSVGADKQVKCWDLETNTAVRHYHGHMSGVYCCCLHPSLPYLFTGGRDSSVRIWDIRTRESIHILTGHNGSVISLATQNTEPQLISGSIDGTIRVWDIIAGKPRTILTHHKKSVRSLKFHPHEYSFVSASADSIRHWKCPEAKFIKRFNEHNAIINDLAISEDDVLVSCADNGTLKFWDWGSGYCFQNRQSKVQSGSLVSEAGIRAAIFDLSGSRLITCETDKTIKIWHEDENSTEETHPIVWKTSIIQNLK